MPCKRFGIGRDAHVRQHGAVLLREPRLIELDHGLALEMRGEAEQPACGHDSRAADAGDQHVVHAVERGLLRLRQARQRRRCERARRIALRALSVTKLGQNPFKQLKSWLHED